MVQLKMQCEMALPLKMQMLRSFRAAVRGERRKAGSGTTEQGMDQPGRSGSRRGNEQVMNKFKLKATS